MTATIDESTCHCDTDEKEKGEVKVVWTCIYRMYNCLLAVPVLSLMGAVLLLGGNFEGDTYRFRQILKDFSASTELLNITRHFSQEAALSHVLWVHQSENARSSFHEQITVTDQFLLNAIEWLPQSCAKSLGIHRDADGLFQRFLNTRAGVEFNETPLAMDKELFDHFVFDVAVCTLADTSSNLLWEELKSDVVYHHLLAAAISLQHITVKLEYECHFTPKNASLDLSQLALPISHARFSHFLSTKEMSRFRVITLNDTQTVCSDGTTAKMKTHLDALIDETTEAQKKLKMDAEMLLRMSDVDLFSRSFLVIATVVALTFALYVFGSASQRSRDMARAANVISVYVDAQSRKKENSLELCLPRSMIQPSFGMTEHKPEESSKVSASVLVFEIPGLRHVVHEVDCKAAVWIMKHIITLVEEKVKKHRTFVLQQQAATCLVAAVSHSIHWRSWPLCSLADLALDLMTSLADVELTLMSRGQLRPRFGMHTGQALGFVPVGQSPVQYRLVGDIADTARKWQSLSEPNCIRLSWETFSALQQSGEYICVEADAFTDDYLVMPSGSPAFYLAGKRTCQFAYQTTVVRT